ncbi:hypothetical protein ACMUEC_19170, partial [Vibrio cholerae]|uniref:hypothetical protein n=1 Tax=Vibrio cholerae TaxID=666 RepID=UPI0039C9442E
STYRQGLHGFFVKSDSGISAIREPKDAAGLRIIVGAGTNQERILLKWSDENVAAGLKPINSFLISQTSERVHALTMD